MLYCSGLLEGYTSEKKQTDETLRSLEDGKEALIVELERTRSRLQDLEESQVEMEQRENNLARQQEVLSQSMGQEEQGTRPTSLSYHIIIYRNGCVIRKGQDQISYCDLKLWRSNQGQRSQKHCFLLVQFSLRVI